MKSWFWLCYYFGAVISPASFVSQQNNPRAKHVAISGRRRPQTILTLLAPQEIGHENRARRFLGLAAGLALADGDHGAHHAVHRRVDGIDAPASLPDIDHDPQAARDRDPRLGRASPCRPLEAWRTPIA